MESNIATQRSYRSVARLAVVALTAATLSACIQTTATPDRTASRSFVQRAAPQEVATVTPRKQRTRVAARSQSTSAADGTASFYRQGSRTASGEKFDPNELTAAHRTLPFGTRLRVTNVATGQSVTVRINDRGPFIPGRHVDLSQGAAETLGIVHRGIAKVKLDVLE